MVTDTALGDAPGVEGAATMTAPAPRPYETAAGAASRHGRLHRGSVLVVLAALVMTLVLSAGAAVVNRHNEDRLLRQRAREVSLVLGISAASAQLPLAAAGLVARATDGDAGAFRSLMTSTSARAFVSASLWRIDRNPPEPLVVVGNQPLLVREPASRIAALFAKSNDKALTINDLLDRTPRRVGYAMTSPGERPRYAVYTETQLPKNRQASIATNSAFSDLGYALYLGTKPNDAKLLASDTGHELSGDTASAVAAFGDSSVLVVVKAEKQLGGTVLLRLPWILLAAGLLLTAGSMVLVERLIRRRESAETLALALDAVATENARLYNEQRSVARTLQHTLLPAALPSVGLDLAARYVAGEIDIEIGGDWYDVVPLDEGRFLLVIGDVSGRGIPAATVMASLRYSVRAYAAQGDPPDVILAKLGRLLSAKDDGHFATVFCARIDLASHRLEAANAGHLVPLLLTAGRATFLEVAAGVPIGAVDRPSYRLSTIELPAQATLLLYTDGLIERRGEQLDIGFARLARAAEKDADAPVETLLDRVVSDLIPGGANDDTALLGLRWEA